MTGVRPDYVFDTAASRRGYALNTLLMSLREPQARAAFVADEAGYCDGFGVGATEKQAVLDRDWVALLEAGVSIFYLYKLALVDGVSVQYLGGVFTGLSEEDFRARLRSHGSVDG